MMKLTAHDVADLQTWLVLPLPHPRRGICHTSPHRRLCCQGFVVDPGTEAWSRLDRRGPRHDRYFSVRFQLDPKWDRLLRMEDPL